MSSSNGLLFRRQPKPGTRAAARREAAEQRSAKSRREIYERRLTETGLPRNKLSVAIGWLMAECKRRPEWIPRALATVLELARRINRGGGDEPADERN